jgi:hypothetical protein
VKVLVAATLRSSPTPSGRTRSAARASGEVSSLVIASARAPPRRAPSIADTMSGDWPDWEMPMASASRTSGLRLYTE